MKKFLQIRQGDVLLQQVDTLPQGCTELPPDGDRIVLAHGEVTGHAHAIYDHLMHAGHAEASAADITKSAIAQAQAKARLFVAQGGDRYLVVTDAVNLRHEEHTSHVLEPGIYHLPSQVEYTPGGFFFVGD